MRYRTDADPLLHRGVVSQRRGGEDLDRDVAAGRDAQLVGRLDIALRTAADALPEHLRVTAAPILTVAAQLSATAKLPAAAREEHLFALEATLLEGCWAALPEPERSRLGIEAVEAAKASGATGAALRQNVQNQAPLVIHLCGVVHPGSEQVGSGEICPM